MNPLNQGKLGALRGLLVGIVMVVVTWAATASNLHGLVPDALGVVIAAIALAIEHVMASGTTTALFGTVSTQKMQ